MLQHNQGTLPNVWLRNREEDKNSSMEENKEKTVKI